MMIVLWLVAILFFWTVEGVFQPTTKSQLQTATNAWCSNPSSAQITYGPISEWDIRLITDTSSLFQYRGTCNPDIGSWDTSQVSMNNDVDNNKDDIYREVVVVVEDKEK